MRHALPPVLTIRPVRITPIVIDDCDPPTLPAALETLFGATRRAGIDAAYTLDELHELPWSAKVWGIYPFDVVDEMPSMLAWTIKRDCPDREFWATEQRARERRAELDGAPDQKS